MPQVEHEIKALHKQIMEETAKPQLNYRKLTTQHRLLTFAFALLSRHESKSPWQRHAVALMDLHRRVGLDCRNKQATAKKAVQAAAKVREDLFANRLKADSLRTQAAKDLANKARRWENEAHFIALMKRQETAYRLRIRAWTADTQRAGKHRSDILHEAAMLGVIAEILQDESYELSGEKDYRHDCHQLQMRAAEIITAVQADRYEQARVSARKIHNGF